VGEARHGLHRRAAGLIKSEGAMMTRNRGTHGKIDRAALPRRQATGDRRQATARTPAPQPNAERRTPNADLANTPRDEAFVAPRSPLEQRLAEIVAGLLGLEQVGRDDNIFLLGGHSLLGLQLIAWVADTFDVDLPLQVLFTAPTVAQLAVEIERLILVKIEAMSDDEVQHLLG
jgi:acyl carrier protein